MSAAKALLEKGPDGRHAARALHDTWPQSIDGHHTSVPITKVCTNLSTIVIWYKILQAGLSLIINFGQQWHEMKSNKQVLPCWHVKYAHITLD
jgi:hypothetical protein